MEDYKKFGYIRQTIQAVRRGLMVPLGDDGEEGAFRRSISAFALLRDRDPSWFDIGERSAMAYRRCIEKTIDDHGANPMAMSDTEKNAYSDAVDRLANWLERPVSELP